MHHVYILSNPAFDTDIHKIGFTSGCVIDRAKNLSSDTGVPLPFTVEYNIEVQHGYGVEQLTHNLLKAYRINANREFFKVAIAEAISAVEKAEALMTPELAARYERERVKRAEALNNGIKVEARKIEPRPKPAQKTWKPSIERDAERYNLDGPWPIVESPKSGDWHNPGDQKTKRSKAQILLANKKRILANKKRIKSNTALDNKKSKKAKMKRGRA